MKKFTFILMLMLAYSGFTMAQVIENFESGITMGVFASGSTGAVGVVANPDMTGANTSLACGMMLRAKDGNPWQGWASNIPVAIDADANRYVHVKIWKSRISKVVFKYEKKGILGSNTGDVTPIAAQTVANGWEELVFDMNPLDTASIMQYRIVLIPDFVDPVNLTEDITLYFDDIYVNNDPAVGSEAVQVIEDFEYIPLNPLNDQGTFTLIANPDRSGNNYSATVMDFLRLQAGVPWSGFWSQPATPIDVSKNKYVHVKLWKPRISPVKFKLENSQTDQLEIVSLNTQTKTNAWEDFVFDFSAITSSSYIKIALIPDATEDALTSDIHIYIDDILVSSDPTPIPAPVQIINVDMHGAGLTTGQKVWFGGTFGGIYGSWSTPGSMPATEMLDADGDSIYSVAVGVADGSYELKFWRGEGWGPEDPAGNRVLPVNGSFDVTYDWGVKSGNITLNVDMTAAGLVAGDKVYVAGKFPEWAEPGTKANLEMKDPDGDHIYSITVVGSYGSVAFKFFKGSGWNGGEWAGSPDRTLTVAGDMTANYVWGSLGQVGVKQNPIAGKIRMYPNPVRDELRINTSVDVSKVIITNTVGKVVRSFNYSSNETISTSTLSRGIYFVTFIGRDGNKETQKLIKN